MQPIIKYIRSSDFMQKMNTTINGSIVKLIKLGVQQCFGVVLRYINAKTGGLFCEGSFIYHDEYIVESFSTTTKQSYYILFQIRKKEAWVITNQQLFASVLKESESCWRHNNFIFVLQDLSYL